MTNLIRSWLIWTDLGISQQILGDLNRSGQTFLHLIYWLCWHCWHLTLLRFDIVDIWHCWHLTLLTFDIVDKEIHFVWHLKKVWKTFEMYIFQMKRLSRCIFATNMGSPRSVQGVTWLTSVMAPHDAAGEKTWESNLLLGGCLNLTVPHLLVWTKFWPLLL